MTNETTKTLEERTKSRLESIERLIHEEDSSTAYERSVSFMNQVFYKQNQIIIDHLQEIYKNQSEVKK